jgi:PAS domain S-box-containing protein
MRELPPSIFARLRGLLQVTRLVRSESDLPTLLEELARTVADSLGFRTVVVNLYRPAWDAFEVAAVHGNDEARRLLLGETRDRDTWAPLLDDRFERRGAYLIPNGEFDWDGEQVASYVPELEAGDDPGAWDPRDALLVPMRHSDGHLLGVLSVDEPRSGRKPANDELDVLVAVADHVAIALQSAQESAQAARHALALEQLLAVSATLLETRSLDEMLTAVCAGVRDALGFGKATVELHDEHTGVFAVRAGVGIESGTGAPLTLGQFEALLDPRFEVEGCYLIPDEAAHARLGAGRPRYVSELNGRGPHAWSSHWLLVPLHGRDGTTSGFLWVDAPADRLLPSPQRLQALRAFANQAASALDAAAQLEALREANERRQALIAASPLAIVDLGLDGRVRSWNPAAERMFGWREEEVLGRPIPTVPPEQAAELAANLERTLSGESTRGLELERRRRDGTRIEIDLSTAPLTDSAGEVSGAISVIADVTERRRAERALVASEARTAAVLEAALDSVITIDHEGRIVEFNRAAEETFGWTSGEVLGRSFLDVAIPVAHRGGLEQTFGAGATPLLGTRLETEALHSDGRTFSAELVVSRVGVEGPPLFTACLRDITRRKAQEEQLRETAAKYRSLVERLPIATYLNDLGLPIRTTWISPQIEAMVGFLPEEWLADGFFEERVHPDDRARVLADVERTHLTGESFRSEYRLVAKDGRVVRVRDETVAVRDEEYRPLFLQGFLIDVGERSDPDVLSPGRERLRLVG